MELNRGLGQISEDVAISLNWLASAENDSGDLDAAERDYREALRIARIVDYAEGITYISGNLASLALDREDWPGAEALAREGLLLAEKLGRLDLIASDCGRLAEALLRQGKNEEGLPYARRAVDIYRRLRAPEMTYAKEILADCESAESGSD